VEWKLDTYNINKKSISVAATLGIRMDEWCAILMDRSGIWLNNLFEQRPFNQSTVCLIRQSRAIQTDQSR